MRARNSIVVRTAIYAAGLCGLVCVVVFASLFAMQRRVYETRLVSEAEESISKIAGTLVGFFYSQGDFVHLEDQQRLLNKSPNVLYNYIVNSHRVVDLGTEGFRSPDMGKEKQTWEPEMKFSRAEVSRVPFVAPRELATKFAGRVKAGDRIVLIGAPINCSANGEFCGQLRVAVAFETIGETMRSLRLTLTLAGLLLTVGIAFIVFWTTRRSLLPIRVISERMRDLAQASSKASSLNAGAELSSLPPEEAEETRYFRESLQQFTSAYQHAQDMESELKLSRSLADLAAQVAHDIRSPLAALEIFSSSLSQLPEDRRIMLRSALGRIRDIANNLLSGNQLNVRSPRSLPVRDEKSDSPPSTYLLASLVDELLSEKRAQYRSRRHVYIDGKLGDSAYGLFVAVNAVEFKRVLSNLINNAVEAIGAKGHVGVHVLAAGDCARIEVRDSGKGISGDVLPNLMTKGFSHGKQGGVGLGLFHAKQTVESWGGSIAIDSKVGEGTRVGITLPRVTAPDWFVPELRLPARATVIVLDDDTSIHEVWQDRLRPAGKTEHSAKVLHFSMPSELVEWHEREGGRAALYLMDYEFIGAAQTGIDLVEALKIQDRTILVTSRFEEPNVLEACARLKVRLVPKSQAAFVPILHERAPSRRPDGIIIDDDPLVRDAWEVRGREAGKEVLAFESIAEFERVRSDIDRSTPVFVDSVLGDEMKGEDYTKELSLLGFENVYLATGYPSSFFAPMPWLKGIVEKTPPAWLAPLETESNGLG